MLYFAVFLIVLVCVLLVVVVLAQNSKGGGLAMGMGSTSQVMGTRRTADIMEKATWVLASTLFVLCLTMNIISGTGQSDNTNVPTTTTTTTTSGNGGSAGGTTDGNTNPSGTDKK
ncbi:MAG: preprotein translocase subunit SecG [Bacteroidia bacterium]|jgi:preprotein translocase subunit SecG